MKKDFIKRTLSNGIVVYLYKDKNLKRLVASYNVKYGSNGYFDKFYYENKPYHVPHAMAHFLEHTLVEKSKLGNMFMNFKNKNYDSNGLTYPEITSFYFVGIKDTWESLKELIQMIDEPVFTSTDIEEVKYAILEEVTKNEDDPYRIGFNLNMCNLYRNYETTTDNYNTLGTKESTMSITYEDAKICYDAYYNDENKFLVIGGNFEIDEMIEYLESIYKSIKPHPNKMKPFDYPDTEEYFKVRCEYEEIEVPVSHDFCIVSYKMRSSFKENLLLVDLCLYIFYKLKFGSETKFIHDLIKDNIISGGIGASNDFFNDNLVLTFSTDVINIEEFTKKLEDALSVENLEEESFELVKKNLKVSELNKMDYIYRSILKFPTEINFSKKLYVMDILDKCTLEDLKDIIRELDLTNKTVTILKKKKVN